MLRDLRVRLLKSHPPHCLTHTIPGPKNDDNENIKRVSKANVNGKVPERSSHESVVNTVALWDSRLTRRPFSRWTAAASHCGYEEENRDERKHFSRLQLTLPLGKPIPAHQSMLKLTLCVFTFNCVYLGRVKPREKL